MILMKYLPPVKPKMFPKLRMLKIYRFGTCISSMPISILMSKIILKKYLPPITPKLVLKLKMIMIY